MKRKIFRVFLALVLMVNFSFIMVMPTAYASTASPTYIAYNEANSGYVGSTPTAVKSILITKPTSTTVGNLLIAELTWDSNVGPGTITPPTDWTKLNEAKYTYSAGNSAVTVGVYYKIVTLADASVTSYTWNWTTAESVYAFILLITGNDTNNPINVSGVAEGYSNTPTCPTVTTTVDGTLVLRLFGSDRGSDSTSYPSGCIGITKRSSGSGLLSGETNGGTAYVTQGTASATSTAAFTTSPTGDNPAWRAFTVVIAPAESQVANHAPNQPTLGFPLDGSTNVDTNSILAVNVSDQDSDNLNVTFYGRKVARDSGEDFSIIVLPDTQFYSKSYPSIFTSQTQWIVDSKEDLNIVDVVHEGDIVDTYSNTSQWSNAVTAMGLLENPSTTGLADGIPYGVLPGNHDQPTTNYNTYFGVIRFFERGYYGGHYGTTNDSNYTLFSVAGMAFIVINLQYSPSAEVLTWANELLQTYSDRRAIVVSHDMLAISGSSVSLDSNGSSMYNALSGNSNLFLMLCGHNHGEGMITETRTGMNPVYILLADYQTRVNGGDGWLRILQFSPANDQISVQTYSPYLNSYETDADSQFVLPYDMGNSEGFSQIGIVSNVTSGSTVSVNWSGLDKDTTYQWYAVVSDGSATATGTKWSFTTGTTNTYTVMATASPSAGGTISGTGTYAYNTSVTLTASSATGYSFAGWEGDYTGNNAALSFTMPAANVIVTANFTRNNYTLAASVAPSAAAAAGCNITGNNSSYYANDPVRLTANTIAGWTFSGWTGTYSGTKATLTFNMPANSVVEIATFTQTLNLALNKPATVDSQQASKGNTAHKGNDGNSLTRWSANNGRLNHWWKVDLGKSYQLTSTKVVFQFAQNYKYKIEVSVDNINWKILVDRTTTTITAQTRQDSFSATPGRYVRITYTGLPSYPATWGLTL